MEYENLTPCLSALESETALARGRPATPPPTSEPNPVQPWPQSYAYCERVIDEAQLQNWFLAKKKPIGGLGGVLRRWVWGRLGPWRMRRERALECWNPFAGKFFR